MSQNLHNSNNQSGKMKEYKTVVALRNINEVADRVEINYSKLDSKSAGDLKDNIAWALNKITNTEGVKEDVKKYAENLKKQNMGYSIDIDYAKIDDEDFSTAYILKSTIQDVLAKRKRDLYTSLTLNTNY